MRWIDPLADQGPHTSGGLVMENTPLIDDFPINTWIDGRFSSHVTRGYTRFFFFGFELIAHLFASNEASPVFHSDGPTNRYFLWDYNEI